MSLLSDLLSKISHKPEAKDTPPGLRNIIERSGKKSILKRQIFFVFFIILLVVISGLAAVHMLENYFSSIPATQTTEPPPVLNALSEKTDTASFQMAEAEVTDAEAKSQSPANRVQKPVKPAGQVISSESVQFKDELQAQSSKQNSKFHAEFQSKFKSTKPDSLKKNTYLYLASGYELKKDYPNALSSYKKALTIDPGDYRVMNKIASLLIELRLFKEALIYLSGAIDIKKDYVPALINAGIAYAGLDELSDAEVNLSAAVALEPYNKFAVFNIALLYEEMGEYDEAQRYYLMLKEMGDIQGERGLARINERLKSRE